MIESKLVDTVQNDVYSRTMITNQLGFLLKLLIFSVLLSLFIKYVAPIFPVTETIANTLVMVLLPTIIMTMVLLSRIIAAK